MKPSLRTISGEALLIFSLNFRFWSDFTIDPPNVNALTSAGFRFYTFVKE